MNELGIKSETKIEISVKQKKQVEHELIGKILPHKGHTLWQINNQTLEVEEAEFSNATYHFAGENRREVIVKKGFTYVSALNIKNALKNFKQGKKGGIEINKRP